MYVTSGACANIIYLYVKEGNEILNRRFFFSKIKSTEVQHIHIYI